MSHDEIGELFDQHSIGDSDWFFENRREHSRADRVVDDEGGGVPILSLNREARHLQEGAERLDDLMIEGLNTVRGRDTKTFERQDAVESRRGTVEFE